MRERGRGAIRERRPKRKKAVLRRMTRGGKARGGELGHEDREISSERRSLRPEQRKNQEGFREGVWVLSQASRGLSSTE